MKQRAGISVLVITYNHEAYIDACLEGIALQKDVDDLEIVVSDDCSTDGTREILVQWKLKLPQLKLLFNEKNLGPARNLVQGIQACNNDYLAFCEGDDYWIEPDKLAREFRVLNEHPKVSLVYTNFHRVDASGAILQQNELTNQPARFEMMNLVFGHGPSTNTILMRKSVFPARWPQAFFEVLNPDVFIFGFALSKGSGMFLNFAGSAYRVHGGGIWSSLDYAEQRLIRLTTRLAMLEAIKPEKGEVMLAKVEREFRQGMARMYAENLMLFRKYQKYLSFTARLRMKASRFAQHLRRFRK